MIIGQYLVLIGIILFTIWINTDLHPNLYRDMFLSFIILYIIGVTIYYSDVPMEVKNASQILKI